MTDRRRRATGPALAAPTHRSDAPPALYKTLANRVLPSGFVARLSDLKGRLLTRVCLRTLAMMSPRQAVRVKEATRVWEKLDYEGRDIYMVIDQSSLLDRVRACQKEPETIAWLEKCLRAGDVLYDVGANVGAYSFVAHALTGGHCRVYAFEPGTSTFVALTENVRVNGFADAIVPLPIALSDETTLQTLHYSSIAPGAPLHAIGDVGGANAGFKAVHHQPVLTYRLDDLVRDFGLALPSHVKIDVDGHEMRVLRGADAVLSHPGLRSMFVEINEWKQPAEEICALLGAKGFEVTARQQRAGEASNYVFERSG